MDDRGFVAELACAVVAGNRRVLHIVRKLNVVAHLPQQARTHPHGYVRLGVFMPSNPIYDVTCPRRSISTTPFGTNSPWAPSPRSVACIFNAPRRSGSKFCLDRCGRRHVRATGHGSPIVKLESMPQWSPRRRTSKGVLTAPLELTGTHTQVPTSHLPFHEHRVVSGARARSKKPRNNDIPPAFRPIRDNPSMRSRNSRQDF